MGVDDCGNVLNPLIVEGQLHGGIAQGLGEALLEQVVYDPETDGLITGSLMDYAVPTAAAMPLLDLLRTATPSPRNPLGMKGVGESGTVSTPPAIANAVLDALRACGVQHMDPPITAQRIWQALHHVQCDWIRRQQALVASPKQGKSNDRDAHCAGGIKGTDS